MSDSVGTLTREASSAGRGQDSEAARRGIGAVVIGRNEGERLAECLRSVLCVCDDVVYVDSGSTDGSVDLAAALGAQVVELDPARPFTAARARNEGIRALCTRSQPPRLVQVVDGDCELAPTWIQRAATFLAENPRAGIVCGRRRERHPEASVYNGLCDMEWDTPVGPADACGGDALMRLAAFEEAGGYNPTMIAGEDPEFSYR
ncbi:MAG: glycosyltransferase family 2 protein, partial [Candidatus Hydrogenedentes bacterium]|nr:glycosyltransferase family 2 protein [Candidatus Hydrogenedentota bacterium]